MQYIKRYTGVHWGFGWGTPPPLYFLIQLVNHQLVCFLGTFVSYHSFSYMRPPVPALNDVKKYQKQRQHPPLHLPYILNNTQYTDEVEAKSPLNYLPYHRNRIVQLYAIFLISTVSAVSIFARVVFIFSTVFHFACVVFISVPFSASTVFSGLPAMFHYLITPS